MKAESVYPTLLLGVSQQAPTVRLEGQMAGQVNMMPDPVKGLIRRPGTLKQAHADGAAPAADAALNTMRQHLFSYDNKDYLICAPTAGYLPMAQPFLIYNETDKHFVSVTFDPADTGVQALMASGLSAITSIGKYIFAASNAGRMQADTVTTWGDDGVGAFGKAALWVRAGAYSRTIKVTVTLANDDVAVFSYTTPSAAFSGTLDTSHVPVFAADPAGGTQTDSEAAYVVQYPDGATTGRAELNWYQWNPSAFSVKRNGVALTNVHPAAPVGQNQYAWNSASPQYVLFDFHSPAVPLTMEYTHTKVIANPNYTKIVSDITNVYNSRLTQWIGEAAEAIRAENVAEELRLQAVTQGCTVSRQDGHLFFEGVKNVVVDDGGDGSLVFAVAHSIQDAADLTKKHWIGKVVRVRPISSKEAFYMKAQAANEGETGWGDVKWIEGTAFEHKLRDGLIYATPSGTAFYVASSAAKLAALLPGSHPDYTLSGAGDKDTSPLPYFVNRPIHYLGVFQDRLLVGSGAVIRASKVGEYLTFFRSSVLTVAADDPLEMLSQGTDDDTIRYSVLYNRSLVLFGKRQYMVNGAAALTPTSAIMPVLSSHAGVDQVQPVASGGFIFYSKYSDTGASVHQLQPGRNSDEAESFPISAQLDDYIPPTVTGISDVSAPNMLLLRVSEQPRTLFVYKYLDTPEGRLQGAWYNWQYPTECGRLVAAHHTKDGVLLLWHRADKWVADLQPLNLAAKRYPHLESMQPYTTATEGSHAAYDSSVSHYLFGDHMSSVPALIDQYGEAGLMRGYLSGAQVVPSPVYVRDREGKPRLSGRLVITNVAITTADSGGFTASIQDLETEELFSVTFVPEIEGLADPDVQTLTSERVPVSVGCANDKYHLTIAARDWLPLTITSLDWTGQFFNNIMRV